MKLVGPCIFALLLGTGQGCAAEDDSPLEASGDTRDALSTACSVGRPPSALRLDPAYQQYCDAGGLPVVAGAAVNAAAVQQAAAVVRTMLSGMPEVARALVASEVRVGIIGEHQVLTDMPENRDIYQSNPGTDWNARTRGVGATSRMPLSSAGEENILCFEIDRYRGENILVHEFAHTIKQMGIERVDSTFKARTESTYRRALAAGRWQRTYASENAEEYWAEGVQDYFDVNASAVPTNGIHNQVHTRAQLRDYDPELFQLIDPWFKGARLAAACPAPRFDREASYRLGNRFLTGQSLDITNDDRREPRMSNAASVSGQAWRITDAGGGAFRLTTAFTGAQLALTASAQNPRPTMQTSRNDPTQRWTIRWASDGSYRVANVAAGESLSLDTPDATDRRPSLQPTATVTGQLWRIDRAPR